MARNWRRGGNLFTWAQLDAMPDVVRQVIQFAPICLGTDRATRALAWQSPAAVARAEIAIARHKSRDMMLQHYGPSHPAVNHD